MLRRVDRLNVRDDLRFTALIELAFKDDANNIRNVLWIIEKKTLIMWIGKHIKWG